MHKPRSIEELAISEIRKSQLARESSKEITGHRPVVTISRLIGSNARAIAETVASDLGWSLWDKELIELVANKAQVGIQMVEDFDEKCMSEIQLLVRAVLGDPKPSGFIYEKYVVQAILQIAELGNCIIMGRGANFVLPNAFHVRIHASQNRRIENVMSDENISRKEATAKVRASDRERREFLEHTYGKDRVRDFLYDLEICTDRIHTTGAVEILETAIRCYWNQTSSKQSP